MSILFSECPKFSDFLQHFGHLSSKVPRFCVILALIFFLEFSIFRTYFWHQSSKFPKFSGCFLSTIWPLSFILDNSQFSYQFGSLFSNSQIFYQFWALFLKISQIFWICNPYFWAACPPWPPSPLHLPMILVLLRPRLSAGWPSIYTWTMCSIGRCQTGGPSPGRAECSSRTVRKSKIYFFYYKNGTE